MSDLVIFWAEALVQGTPALTDADLVDVIDAILSADVRPSSDLVRAYVENGAAECATNRTIGMVAA